MIEGTRVQVVCKKCGFDKVRTSVFPVYCKCGAVIERDGSHIDPSKPSQLPLQGCSKRGPEVRQEQCDDCRGKVKIRVFACSLYGECQAIDKLLGVHVCNGGIEIDRLHMRELKTNGESSV